MFPVSSEIVPMGDGDGGVPGACSGSNLGMWCSKDGCGPLQSSAEVLQVSCPNGTAWGCLQDFEDAQHDDWWWLLLLWCEDEDGVLQELPPDMLKSPDVVVVVVAWAASPIDESHDGRLGDRSLEGSCGGLMNWSCCC